MMVFHPIEMKKKPQRNHDFISDEVEPHEKGRVSTTS